MLRIHVKHSPIFDIGYVALQYPAMERAEYVMYKIEL